MGLFSFVSKIFSKRSDNEDDAPDAPASTPVTVNDPSNGKFVIVKQGLIDTNGTAESLMVQQASVYVCKVVNSSQFRDEVISAQFTSTNDLTNQQIYQALVTGDMLINVSLFDGSFKQNHIWKTMGLDDGDGVVYANRYFIDNPYDLASLIMHEFAHERGFHHDSPTEYSSVPYSMNSIFESVAPQLGILQNG